MQVLGQMFVPGAVDKRRTRASPEEYVNGEMEDYLTSSLVASDCSFSKFMVSWLVRRLATFLVL